MTAKVPIIHVADRAFTIGQGAREGSHTTIIGRPADVFEASTTSPAPPNSADRAAMSTARLRVIKYGTTRLVAWPMMPSTSFDHCSKRSVARLANHAT